MAKRRTKKKTWSTIVEEHGVRIRVYERRNSSRLWYSIVGENGRKVRRSLKTSDRTKAKESAEDLAQAVAEARLLGRRVDNLTLGQLMAAYFRLKAPVLSPKWQGAAEMRRGLFVAAWGKAQSVADISQTHVDRFCRERRSGALAPDRHGREIRTVRDGTLDGDFRWLSSVFNWARRHKVGGRRLLSENPLHDVSWPREANPRRPVASHQRFESTIPKAVVVDPTGRLRCILALARYTGRREGAICALKASDVLRSPQAVRAAIAAAGMDERIAEHMPNGAVRWSDASDKMGLLFVSPLSVPARAELDRYLRSSPRLGDAPLFPSDDDPAAPIRTDVASKRLLKAEAAAGLPKLLGGIFHPYRRLWASERKHLPDVDVAEAGGWRDTRALKLSYQQADPATVLKVVEHGSN